MGQSVICAAVPAPAGPIVSVPVSDVCCDLLELFAGVPDGRAGQGRDHPVAAVLALAAAAVVAGMKGYTAITGWVADVPLLFWRICTCGRCHSGRAAVEDDDLAGAHRCRPGVARRRCGCLADEPGRPRHARGRMPARARSRALMQVRLDGKAIRGAKDADGNQVRLLAALVGPDAAASVVAAQAEVGKKTNEVPMAAVVLDRIDLEGKIVTADALHTVKATADHIHERGGEFVLPVKENRRALFDALDALPWDQVPVAHTATDKGHGRITTRTIQVLPAPKACRSRTSARCSSSSGTSPACTASRSQPSPRSASPARHPGRQAPPTWPATSASNGRSSPCTGSATPCTRKTNPRSEPDPGQESWLRCATSRSAHSAWPGALTSPRPPDGPDAPWTGPFTILGLTS